MARSDFGGTIADFVVYPDPDGRLRLSTATLTFWSAATGGTQYTNLLLGGAPVTSIPVGLDGQIPEFQGPDGVTKMYASAGGTRVLVVAPGTGGGGVSDWSALTGRPANLTAIGGVTSAADKVPYFTGSGTASTATFTAAGRALVDDADAAAQRTTLNVNAKDEAKLYTTAASSATPSPTGTASVNQYVLTAQAAAAAVVNPSGTALDGNYLELVVKDNGTARAFTWGTAYKAADSQTLPTTTTTGKTHYWLFRFNAQSAKWVLVDTRTET